MGVGLRIQLEEIEHRVILRIEGRLDAASSPLLERKINQLMDDGRYHLLLDFSKIDYLSSSGMRVLLSATKKLKIKKGALVVFAVSEEVDEIIKMAAFDKILRICPTEKEALQVHG